MIYESNSALETNEMILDLEGIAIAEMIVKGLGIVQEAIDLYKPVAILAAFSGGNDSIVSTHFGATEFGATVVHCNTGTGLKKTRQHIQTVIDRFGWPMVEGFARPEGKPKKMNPKTRLPEDGWMDGETAYEEYVLNFGFPGPAQHKRMFQRLKERALDRIVQEIKSKHGRRSLVAIISGIRHDESAQRAGYKRAIHKPDNRPNVWINPFYWNTAADFEMYRQEFGLPRNPVKSIIGISGECNCASYAKPGEKELIRQVEPEYADYLDCLEIRVRARGFPWGWGERPPEWWTDFVLGQEFLFPMDGSDFGDDELELGHDDSEPEFMPMCVGCPSRR